MPMQGGFLLMSGPKVGEQTKQQTESGGEQVKKGSVGFLSNIKVPATTTETTATRAPAQKKRPIAELLGQYEKRRIVFEKEMETKAGNENTNLNKLSIERAIRRMSYDYERKEEQLKETYSFMMKREENMERYKLNLISGEGQKSITVANADGNDGEDSKGNNSPKQRKLDFSDTVQ